MRYMGGKHKIGRQIAEVIQAENPQHYHEAFCGAFSVGKHIIAPKRTGADICLDLILLLEAIRDGWEPPSEVSPEGYALLAEAEPSALRGFVGFGCSFYGKFFGGYAREGCRDFVGQAKRSMLRLAPLIQGVSFYWEPYWEYAGDADVIYCDPPYAGTTNFSSGGFDNNQFWVWASREARRRTVFVSEYAAPEGWVAVWQKDYTVTMKDKAGKGIKRVESLFRLA
jgi:DNA adenine methylase